CAMECAEVCPWRRPLFESLTGRRAFRRFPSGRVCQGQMEPDPTRHPHRDPIEHHIEKLGNVFDTAAIRARRLKVAVDCSNGACSRLIPRWLAELGCEVLAINDDPTAAFPHRPEPTPETMAQLSAVVKAGHADI